MTMYITKLSGVEFKTKKELISTTKENPESIRFESTSVFGNEYDGDMINAPDGLYFFCLDRAKRIKFANITIEGNRYKVV